MAKKIVKGAKTAAVREILNARPEAMPLEIVAALSKQGIKITASHVSNIKGKLKKAGNGKRAARPVAAEAAPAVVEKLTNGGTITLEHIKLVAHTVKTLGGLQRVTEILAVIKDLGGVKKFKDLAEAMTAPATDEISY